jgi:hypothetical protein
VPAGDAPLPTIAKAQLQVPIIVQPAEWTGQLNSVSGTRTNTLVTFGLGIPDAWAIPCTLQASPSQLELKNGGTLLNSQFLTTECWPNTGNVKWVLVDAQLPSFTEGSPGYDTTITVTQVASGGGNNPAINMAGVCTGAGTPDTDCPSSGYLYVNATSAHFIVNP